MARPLPVIEAELKAAQEGAARMLRAVSLLAAERAEYRHRRDLAVLADFDAGMARKALAHKHSLNENTLASLMRRNGRSYRKKGLTSAEQQRVYREARRHGAGHGAARQIALAGST